MRLLKKPQTTIETIEIQGCAGNVYKTAGRRILDTIEIVCPDKVDSKDDIWHKLKYGTTPDLADAMHSCKKIQKLEFPEDNLILYGVLPIEVVRSSVWAGRVFTCRIEHFEEK